eukprot:1158375-Pelagomonas_calceolata.AAC.4
MGPAAHLVCIHKYHLPDIALVQGHTPKLIQGWELGVSIYHLLELREVTVQHVEPVHQRLRVLQAACTTEERPLVRCHHWTAGQFSWHRQLKRHKLRSPLLLMMLSLASPLSYWQILGACSAQRQEFASPVRGGLIESPEQATSILLTNIPVTVTIPITPSSPSRLIVLVAEPVSCQLGFLRCTLSLDPFLLLFHDEHVLLMLSAQLLLEDLV